MRLLTLSFILIISLKVCVQQRGTMYMLKRFWERQNRRRWDWCVSSQGPKDKICASVDAKIPAYVNKHTHLLLFLYVWSSTPSFCHIVSKDIFNQTVFICVCVRSILAVWWWYSAWSWPAECGRTTRCVILWINRNAYTLLSLMSTTWAPHGRSQEHWNEDPISKPLAYDLILTIMTSKARL